MWKCPICGNEEKSKYTCKKCGYDTRSDFIQWKTVCVVPKEDVQERVKLKTAISKESASSQNNVEKIKEPRGKSALGFKVRIPVVGVLLVTLIVAFVLLSKDKNRIQSAGVTYEDELDNLCVLGSDVKRREIRTIVFLDTLKRVPKGACWDVSEKQDGSVMAYIRNDNELCFAAEGPIKANEDSSYFFAGYTNVEEIRFNDAFDTSDVTDMTGMFTECHNLSYFDLDALDTSKVRDMSLMFCNNNNWRSFGHELDTRNVTDMSYMFAECDSLESVSIYGLDTRNVTDMTAMFYNCPKLSEVHKLEDWDLSQVTQDADMFTGCDTFPSERYEDFWDGHSEIEKNMLNVDFEGRLERVGFYDDVKLQTKKITFLDTLENAPEEATDVSEHQDGSVMAWYKENREHLIIAADGSVIANPDRIQLFVAYQNLEEIDFNHAFDTSRMTDMSFMFCRCLKLKKVDANSLDTSQVTNMRGMFRDCNLLEILDISSFDTSNVRDMSYMFTGCRELKQLELGNFEMDYFPSTTDMFLYCESLDSEIYEGIWNGNLSQRSN